MQSKPTTSRQDQAALGAERLERKRISVAVGAILTAIVVCALYFAREVLIPITLAGLLTFVLAPVVSFMRRLRIPRVPATIGAVLLALALIGGIGSLIGTQVADLVGQFPAYQTTIETKWVGLRNAVLFPIRNIGLFSSTPAKSSSGSQAKGGAPKQKPIPVEVQRPTPSAYEIGKKLVTPLIHPLATFVIMLVVTIFALLYREDLRDRAIRLFGSRQLSQTTIAMDDAAHRLSRYYLTQLAINTCFGVIVGVGLFFIGLPHPILWGVMGAVLRFVPYIGAWISAVLPVLFAAAAAPGWSVAAFVAGLFVVTEFAAGQFIEPLLYGHNTGLSPIAVLVAAVFWTWLWGPIGLIISTPLTLCLVVLGQHFEQLTFFDVLLGSTPALTMPESLYQRLLAADLDEAQEQMEDAVSNGGLIAYFDQIVVPALKMASVDFRKGRLSPPDSYRLCERFDELTELAIIFVSKEPGPISDSGTLELKKGHRVLVLPGRGPFDRVASAIMTRCLEFNGITAVAGLHEDASRHRIGSLDLEEIAAVCVLYVEPATARANVKYFLGRLKHREPELKLIFGFVESGVLRAGIDSERSAADMYVSTIEEAKVACVAAAKSQGSMMLSE